MEGRENGSNFASENEKNGNRDNPNSINNSKQDVIMSKLYRVANIRNVMSQEVSFQDYKSQQNTSQITIFRLKMS